MTSPYLFPTVQVHDSELLHLQDGPTPLRVGQEKDNQKVLHHEQTQRHMYGLLSTSYCSHAVSMLPEHAIERLAWKIFGYSDAPNLR